MDTLYILMPAYNEEENIEAIIEQWYPVLRNGAADSKLVVADSGSTDNTHEMLLEMQGKYPQLEILENTDKQHGPKIMALYAHAISQGADWIFQTDSDGQTNPKEFPGFWNDRRKYDCVIGNRTVRGDGISRYLVEKVVCIMLRVIFGVKVPDANAPFRLMKSDIVAKYIYRLPNDFNIPNIMFTAYFAYYKEKIEFKKITFKPRMGGKNSINMKKIFGIGCKALGDFWTLRSEMK